MMTGRLKLQQLPSTKKKWKKDFFDFLYNSNTFTFTHLFFSLPCLRRKKTEKAFFYNPKIFRKKSHFFLLTLSCPAHPEKYLKIAIYVMILSKCLRMLGTFKFSQILKSYVY
jgi:hypothetical protein